MARLFESTTPTYLSGSFAPVSSLPLTVACWVYRSTATGNEVAWSIDDSGNAGNNMYLISSGTGDATFNMNNNWTNVNDLQSGWTEDAWIPIVCTCSSSEIACWVDGSNAAAVSHSQSLPTVNQFEIGNWTALGNDFDGAVAHFATWSIILSDDNIAAFSAGFSPLLIRRDALTYYCEVEGNSGTGAEVDLVGGNDMTPSGDSGFTVGPSPIYRPSSPIIIPPPSGGGGSVETIDMWTPYSSQPVPQKIAVVPY